MVVLLDWLRITTHADTRARALEFIWFDQSEPFSNKVVWNKIVDCGRSFIPRVIHMSIPFYRPQPLYRGWLGGGSSLQMTLGLEQTVQREGCEALLTSWTLFLLPLASWCGAAAVSINTFWCSKVGIDCVVACFGCLSDLHFLHVRHWREIDLIFSLCQRTLACIWLIIQPSLLSCTLKI